MADILAKDIKPGDVWLGDGTELAVHDRDDARGFFIPWGSAKTTKPVEMGAVRIFGKLTGPQYDKPFIGTWTLQEDQPLEVRRDG